MKQIHEKGGERGKTRASKAKIGFSFISDCRKSGASYLTNQCVVKQNQDKCELLSTLNRPFSSCVLPLFQSEAWCTTSYENEFYLHVNENSFSYVRLRAKNRFEKEVQDKSQLAYWKPHYTNNSIAKIMRKIKEVLSR